MWGYCTLAYADAMLVKPRGYRSMMEKLLLVISTLSSHAMGVLSDPPLTCSER
jgi:hypothetical protein